jgi:hypothetical protein
MKFFGFAIIVLSSPAVFCDTIVNRQFQEKTFSSQDECHLTRFAVSTFDTHRTRKDSRPGQFSSFLNTTMAAVWETNKPECVKDFGVVQYIKGCVYSIEYDPQTKTENKYFGIVRDLKDKSGVRFQHKDWEVDTIDLDPLYNSYAKEDANLDNRLQYQKAAMKPLVLKNYDSSLGQDEKIYFNSKNYNWLMNIDSPLSQLFTTDLPNGSDYGINMAMGKDWASISSLEFKTCLYKLSDIPLTGEPESFDVSHENGGPIECFDWSDKATTDYESKTIKRTDKLDPFCFEN